MNVEPARYSLTILKTSYKSHMLWANLFEEPNAGIYPYIKHLGENILLPTGQTITSWDDLGFLVLINIRVGKCCR